MQPDHRSIEVSIVIAALNEERMIGRCLSALADLDFPKNAFEVILIDNGSTDRTVEIAESFAPPLRLRVLKEPGLRISAMRNRGVADASGRVVAFLDADCVAPAVWLKNAMRRLSKERIGVLGAHYRIPEDSRWVARAWFGGAELERQGNVAWVPAGDMIMARDTFETISGFDESIQTNEDCEICERARAKGFRVVADPAVAVVHLGTPQTLLQFYRKIRWHATDGLNVFLRSLPVITNPRPLLFAAYTLACAGGLLTGLAIFARSGRLGPALVFLAAWLTAAVLLSVRLAAKRRRWSALPALTILHLAFGLARAEALLKTPWSVRRG